MHLQLAQNARFGDPHPARLHLLQGFWQTPRNDLRICVKSLSVYLGGVSKDFIKDLRESGELPYYKVRKTIYYPPWHPQGGLRRGARIYRITINANIRCSVGLLQISWDFKHPWCFYKRTQISRIYRITINANIRCSMGLRQISWDFKHLWCFWRRTRITRIYRITINDNIRCSAVIREISKHRRCFLSVVIRKIRVIRVQKK